MVKLIITSTGICPADLEPKVPEEINSGFEFLLQTSKYELNKASHQPHVFNFPGSVQLHNKYQV
jgi:hypothetical protein